MKDIPIMNQPNVFHGIGLGPPIFNTGYEEAARVLWVKCGAKNLRLEFPNHLILWKEHLGGDLLYLDRLEGQ